ncbi:hypothetical protein OROMI_034987 [Orobanche minor]
MVKRRNEEKKNYFGGEGIITSSKGCGGGGGNNDNMSVFEFACDDLRVETESRKTLAKFRTKSPCKEPSHHSRPIDKYVFLECFARGTTTHHKDSRSDVLDVDVTRSASRNRSCGTNMTISPDSISDDHPSYFLKHHGYEYSSCSKSCARGSRRPGGYTTGEKHNKVLYVDCDDDGRMDLRSSNSFDLADNEGSLKNQASEYGANDNDCQWLLFLLTMLNMGI